MSVEVWKLVKAMPTLLANVRPLPRMRPLVCDKIWLQAKALATLLAHIRLEPWVCPLMREEVWFPSKASSTLLAHIWFLPRVYPLVCDVVWLAGKASSTFCAYIRLWPRMRPLVFGEDWRTAEVLSPLSVHVSGLSCVCLLEAELVWLLDKARPNFPYLIAPNLEISKPRNILSVSSRSVLWARLGPISTTVLSSLDVTGCSSGGLEIAFEVLLLLILLNKSLESSSLSWISAWRLEQIWSKSCSCCCLWSSEQCFPEWRWFPTPKLENN